MPIKIKPHRLRGAPKDLDKPFRKVAHKLDVVLAVYRRVGGRGDADDSDFAAVGRLHRLPKLTVRRRWRRFHDLAPTLEGLSSPERAFARRYQETMLEIVREVGDCFLDLPAPQVRDWCERWEPAGFVERDRLRKAINQIIDK